MIDKNHISLKFGKYFTIIKYIQKPLDLKDGDKIIK